ncbi:DUF4199 domain-containing protein [uncultured Arcticibacterium sp.]|uniref:DUF4199 domain-containing protein n=1 Tax=uncultured Arcticibacterium sp. TaxID=2173042 RepID=UPI0030F9CC8A
MNKKVYLFSLIFGLAAGILCFLFFLMLYAGEVNPLQNRRPDIVINVLIIFLAIWFYKSRNGGFIHFYEGFTIGFLTNLIAALVTGLAIYCFIKWIDPTPFESWISGGKEFLIGRKEELSKFLNEESYKLQLEAFDKAKPYQVILDDLMFKQFSIVAIMLISMALRKQRDAIS